MIVNPLVCPLEGREQGLILHAVFLGHAGDLEAGDFVFTPSPIETRCTGALPAVHLSIARLRGLLHWNKSKLSQHSL